MPFLFRNKANKKWVSFENDSTTYNNRNITITDCKVCEKNTVPANMPDSSKGEYMIKVNDKKNHCLFPNGNNELISGDCKNDGKNIFELMKLKPEYLDNKLPNQIQVSIGFNDNETANVNKNTSNWGKKLSASAHKFHRSSDRSKTKFYNIIKDPILYLDGKLINKPSINDFLTENIEIRCKIFHLIQEYNSRNQLLSKKMYRLKFVGKEKIGDIVDKSIAGIFMYVDSNERELSNSSSQSPDVVISYFGKRDYTRSTMDDMNVSNYSRAYIGTILPKKSTVNHGYINTEEYKGGIIIKDSVRHKTVFRVIPNDSIFNRMVKYSYPKQSMKDDKDVVLNISSYVNPNKKMYVKKNNIVSQNIDDETNVEGGIFNVVPVTESFSLMEGYNDYSIQEEIRKLNEMMSRGARFDTIIAHIKNILNFISKNNAEDEYAHIVNIYRTDLTNIKYCFSYAEKLYKNIVILHKNMTDNYLKIGLDNVYGNTEHDGAMTFDDNLANKVVDQLNKLKKEIAATKSHFKNKYDMSVIELDGDILFLLINMFKYFQTNYDRIQKHVNVFFDYNEVKNYVEYLKTKSFAYQIRLGSDRIFHYYKLLNMETGTLKKRIQYGETLKNKSKVFFDKDFGEIYDQLFIDANSGSRNFVKTRIGKILHKDKKITSKFISNQQSRGVMHYYHDFLLSQEEYYKKFNELKVQKNHIDYFKNNLPTTNNPATIFQFYRERGKKLDSGDSYYHTLMNYYSNLSQSVSTSNTTRQSEIFLSLFKNMRYYDEKGLLFSNVNYSSFQTDNLYKYYEDYYFINKKSEPSIIRAFMNKYNVLANAIEANSGNHDGIISINDESLKATEAFSNIENFSVERALDYHPTKPSIISANSSSDYDTGLLNDAFYYESKNKGEHVDLKTFLNEDYLDGDLVSNTASCSGADGNPTVPNIVMSYSCGNTTSDYGGNSSASDYKYVNDFFKDTSCKSSTLAIDNTIKLTYLNDDASKRCEVKIEDSNGTTYSISDSIPHTDMLEVFDDQNGVTSLTTKYESHDSDQNNMDYLEDINQDTNEPSSSSSVLYDTERYFRLYIQNGEVKLDYKLSRGLLINDQVENYNTAMKGLVDPTVPLSDQEMILHVYKNEKNVGEYLNKSVYIDSAGVSHNIDSSKLNTQITATGTDGTDDAVYSEYDKMCYSGIVTSNANVDNPLAKFGSNVYLEKDELKNVYPSVDGDCIGSSDSSELYLKKNQFNSDHGACLTDPEYVNMIDINRYDNISGSSSQFSEQKCDKKHVFSGSVTKFKKAREEFREKFANMIGLFNELNENELNMLDETQAIIDNLKDNIVEYNELYDKAIQNSEKKTIIDAQANDTELLVKKSQYNMALVGIGAIGATMLMFNYMKNS